MNDFAKQEEMGWQCSICGYITIHKPELCNECQESSSFERLDIERLSRIVAAVGGGNGSAGRELIDKALIAARALRRGGNHDYVNQRTRDAMTELQKAAGRYEGEMVKEVESSAEKRMVNRSRRGGSKKKRERVAVDSFMETRQAVVGVNCTECGACCCPPVASGDCSGDQAYVELCHSDLVLLGSGAGEHLVRRTGNAPNTSGYFLRANKGINGAARCPFFVGEVGQTNCGCGIYGIRPHACKIFEKGGEGCLSARANHPAINPELHRVRTGEFLPREGLLDEQCDFGSEEECYDV